VQKRIDELTANWRNAERREQERADEAAQWRQLALQNVAPQNVYSPEPVFDDVFDDGIQPQTLSPEALLAEAKRLLRQEAEAETMQSKTEQFKASVSDPETLEFLNSPHAPISREMADIMLEHEAGTQIAEWLAKNQSEAARIAKLPPHKQALELIKAASSKTAKVVKTTGAPAPPPTIGGRGVPDVNPEKMTTEQWMKWRNAQLRKG
jgi:hypothetical protein